MTVLLISTYDLGRQPFSLASAAAWLREQGHTVELLDLAIDPPQFPAAEAVAFSLPMHTATRLAAGWIPRLLQQQPGIRIACFGLYAPLNAEFLRSLGVEAIFGGEFEGRLTEWVASGTASREESASPDRLAFRVPDRSGLS